MIQDAGAIIVNRHGREPDLADASGLTEIDYYLRTHFAAQERRKIAERTVGGRKIAERTVGGRNVAAAAGRKPQGATPYGFNFHPLRGWCGAEPRPGLLQRQ